jgi:hypothetical protein
METLELAVLVALAMWLACRLGAQPTSDRSVTSLVDGLAAWRGTGPKGRVSMQEEHENDRPWGSPPDTTTAADRAAEKATRVVTVHSVTHLRHLAAA